MKSFRRSLGEKSKDGAAAPHGAGLPTTLSKPTASIQPPKKVIRAKESHVSTSPQELPFNKGDFFYVVGERDDPHGGPGYYEALNTMSNARGLVSKAKFEEFGRSGAHGSKGSISESRSSVQSPTGSQHSGPSRSSSTKAAPRKELYGKMMYDFVAERDDELSALKDEPVLIQAISTEDWFVAKKIVTVSKPGLIPVSFVEILDPATGLPHADVPRLLRESALPDVKEWREKTESYASSTIPLGRLDDGAPSQGVANSPYAAHPSAQQPQQQQRQSQQSRGSSEQYHSQHQRQPSAQHYASTTQQRQLQRGPSSSHHHGQQPSLSRSIQSDLEEGMLPPGTFSSACVVSFHQEKVDGREEYFFRIHAVFLPDDPAEKASRLILFRTYDHFYRFQIDLLDTFPAEAGRPDPANPSAPPPRRILPYMPGPLDEVNDAITHDRRSELDSYIRFLIALHRIRADYVLSSPLVRSFFHAGKSDGNSPVPREVAERELEAERSQEPLVDLEDSMDNLGLGDGDDDGHNGHRESGGSHQRHHSRTASQQQQLQRGPSLTLSQSAGSSQGGGAPGRTASPLPPIDTNLRRTPYSASNGLVASQRPPSNDYASGGLPSAVSSSWGSNAGGGGGSVLGSGLSPMTPGPLTAGSTGSGSGQQGGGSTAAYKKIKIYDSTTDDVMAIRVPPNVTFDQLSQKVQDRLGGGRRVLSFRDSVGSGKGANRGIEDDRDLLDWMSRTDKLVLYAD